jgi:hypothetical protein
MVTKTQSIFDMEMLPNIQQNKKYGKRAAGIFRYIIRGLIEPIFGAAFSGNSD